MGVKRSKKPATGQTPPETTEEEVGNAQHELFCIYFTRSGTETFNNATLSYAEAYGFDLDNLSVEAIYKGKGKNKKLVEMSPFDKAYRTAGVSGKRLLKKDNISKRIDTKLNELYGSENAINARLAKIAFKEVDDSQSLIAIRDINKLRRRLGPKEDEDDGEKAQPITRIEIIMPKGMKAKVA